MAVPVSGQAVSPSGLVYLQGRRLVVRGRPERGTCTWCGGPVTDPRRSTWCSRECVERFHAGTPERQRAALEAREQGRCQACGVSTDRLRRAVLRWVVRSGGRVTSLRGRERAVLRPELADRLAHLLSLRGRATDRRTVGHLLGDRASWWDMDHRVPIADGGHPYASANLRTLCYWCHKDATARAATARAEARRAERECQMALF